MCLYNGVTVFYFVNMLVFLVHAISYQYESRYVVSKYAGLEVLLVFTVLEFYFSIFLIFDCEIVFYLFVPIDLESCH